MCKSPNFQRPVYRATKPSMSKQYRIRQRSKLVYLDEVTQCLGEATGRGEDVLNSSELEDLLGDTGGDDPRPRGHRHHAHGDGAALDGDLAGHGVGLSDLFPQYLLLTGTLRGTTESLARMMAPRMAVATSSAHLTPSPTCPSPRRRRRTP